jgi:uncharacterized protein (TIGR02147 family)
MVSIYQFDSYKTYFNSWVEQQPKKGHGEYRRLSIALNVSTTMVSQIFNSEKDLSLEMACEMAEYLLLNDEEADYFLLLVEYSKAGSAKLRSRLQKQIKDRQEKAKKLENRLKNVTVLDIHAKQIYYSSWLYPAIRLLTDIPEVNTAEQISQRLSVPKNQVLKALDYLIKNQIVVQKSGKLSMGPAHTYLAPEDPLANRHMQNWRQLAFQKMNFSNDENFFYTGQYALSKEVAIEIRKQLPDFIEAILKKVKPSKSETVQCLNIDYFEY